MIKNPNCIWLELKAAVTNTDFFPWKNKFFFTHNLVIA